MADQPTKVREVAWAELFPWLMLIRAVRISLLARVLVLGAAGLVATAIGWQLIGEAFSRSTDPVVQGWPEATKLQLWETSFKEGVANPWVSTTARNAAEIFDSAGDYIVQAPMSIWLYLTRPFIHMFDGDLTAWGFLFLLCCVVWELLVWGLFGGAITRIAALKFTRDEAPGILAALKHSLSKLPSFSLPPLIALAGTAVFALQLVVLGFVMRIDFLAFVAALAWPFVILLGLMMAVLLLGALFGWPLMWATVSVEGTDAFDALSRSYAYTYHRPWRLMWYVLFAGFLAVTSMFVVKLFASSAVALGNWSIDWGADDDVRAVAGIPRKSDADLTTSVPPPVTAAPTEPDDQPAPPLAAAPAEPSKILSGAASIVRFWKMCVAVLAAGYQAGFLWVSAVGVYLLLRRDIDGVQMNEVFIDETEEYGMPPLADDPTTGVPEVNPHGAAVPGDRV